MQLINLIFIFKLILFSFNEIKFPSNNKNPKKTTTMTILCNAMSNNTRIENILETEIDLREPKSFRRKYYTEYLSVRQMGFQYMNRYDKHGKYIRTDRIPNWELFALKYWFETRQPYSDCPMFPIGIATIVDWALLIPCMFGNPFIPGGPRIIYVHNYMLPHFIESTLHFMDKSYRFVLISGGTDLTIPRSTDVRYAPLRGFAQTWDGGKYFQALLKDHRLIHWYCENRDLKHAKLSTMPTGFTYPWTNLQSDLKVPFIPLDQRSLMVFLSDRVREGTGQWATRAKVASMCRKIPKYCLHPNVRSSTSSEGGVSHDEYLKLLRSVPFIACPHGGGLDPSPKAWEAILVGTIPIIERSTVEDAYRHFPIVIIDSWEHLFQLNETMFEQTLLTWITTLKPYYEEGSELRKITIEVFKTYYYYDSLFILYYNILCVIIIVIVYTIMIQYII